MQRHSYPIKITEKRIFHHKKDSSDDFIMNHKIWYVFCENADDCDDFVLLKEYLFEKFEYPNTPQGKWMDGTPMIIRDFIILFNLEDQNVEYIGRVARLSRDISTANYNYSSEIEWAQIDPIDFPLPGMAYTENPLLVADHATVSYWRNVIMDKIVN